MVTNNSLKIREFKRSDNDVYSTWFTDPDMDKYMGPAWSSAELDTIEKEDDGVILSVFEAKELVGVCSLANPDNDHTSYGVTGIAVAPHKQRQGIGTNILSALQVHLQTQPGQEWIAFVSPKNIKAQNFMLKNGWNKGVMVNNMYEFTYTQTGA